MSLISPQAPSTHACELGPSPSLETTIDIPEETENSAYSPKRRNIVIASFFGYHFDVYMTIAWTLERVLANTPGSVIQVFAPPFFYGFQKIVNDLGLYHGQVRDPEQLLSYITDHTNGVVDTVFLGTCEFDLSRVQDALLREWDARSEEEKFQLVCVVHNVKDGGWQPQISEWSRRGAIRLLPLGEHVKEAFRHMFDAYAESPEQQLFTAGYEHVRVDTHLPVLDIPNLPTKQPDRVLSKAAIQGSFSTSRRDYHRFFADMIQSLHDDPAAWGYHPLGSRRSFVPDHQSGGSPFELALVGSGHLDIPDELAYMVTVYQGLDYADFYRLVAGMDIVVPAFADFGYFEDQASSTVALAVELDIPILATRRMRKAYQYIDDDRVVVTRPSAMREVQALKALRTGSASFFLENDDSTGGSVAQLKGLVDGVHEMLRMGWVRDRASVREYKEGVWRHNEGVVKRLLRDE